MRRSPTAARCIGEDWDEAKARAILDEVLVEEGASSFSTAATPVGVAHWQPQTELNPSRAASDRDRVVELTRDVWDGHDYVPRVFDDWVSDAGAAFQAIELDGVLVGVQRLRPYSSGLMWYEGLRVASTHRRQGLARAMLRSAIAEAREQRFREMRLATRNPGAARLFEETRLRANPGRPLVERGPYRRRRVGANPGSERSGKAVEGNRRQPWH